MISFDIKLLRSPSRERIDEALALLNSELGESYITSELLVRFLGVSPFESCGIALVAENRDNGRLLGVLLAEIVDDDRFYASFLGQRQYAQESPQLHRLRTTNRGLIKSVAVAREVQGLGLGKRLVQTAIADLESHGAKSFYGLGWTTKEKGCHIATVFNSLGFVKITQFDGFWTEDSLINGYDCPSCGHPCTCSAQLFVRD